MRILIITHTIAPNSGGGRYSRAVIEEYRKQNIEFIVATEKGEAVEIYERRVLVPLKNLSSFIKNILAIRRLARECTIVHAFDGWPYAVYARLALLGMSQKFFINAVGTYAVAALRLPIKGFFLRSAYRRAEKTFAISEFVKNNVLKYIKFPSIEVVYLGTTPLPVPTSDEVARCRSQYKISPNAYPILLTVGAVKDRKGQFETVEAVRILKEKYPHIMYLIVGIAKKGDSYVDKIHSYIDTHSLHENVRIISDAKSDTTLAALYSLSHIFLLNSKYDKASEHSEGFGLVLLEAAHFGKPVIGSKGSGIPEAMEDGKNGCLVDEVRGELIAEAVENVLVHYDSFSQHSTTVAKKFGWKQTAEGYLKSYK